MGMTNPRSASNAMANLRKKMAAATGPMQAAPGDGATPKATPSKRGRAPKKDDIGDEESPTKKKRGGKKVAAVKEEVKQEVKEESDDENGFGGTCEGEHVRVDDSYTDENIDRMDEGEGDATNGAEVDEEI